MQRSKDHTADQNWRITHRTLAISEVTNDKVILRNIRDFRYFSHNEDEPDIHFLDRTFPLSSVHTAWIAIIPFRPHFAHLITSFGLSDGTYLAISIEIRYREGEPYILWKTFLPHYWLSYVIATEDDVFRLRTNVRSNEPVHLYQLAFSPEESQLLMADMLLRAQKVNHDAPERFNSAINSCTSNALTHLEVGSGKKLPLSRSHYFTDTLDPYLSKQGLLKLSEPYTPIVRAAHCINTLAKEIPNDAIDFSARIRRELHTG